MKYEAEVECNQCGLPIIYTAEWVRESGGGYWVIQDAEHEGEPDCRGRDRFEAQVQRFLDNHEPDAGDEHGGDGPDD